MAKKILELTSFDKFNLAKPDEIKIHNEGMVSGSAVVADVDIVNEKIKSRKIYGIDMEAYGVAFACNNAPSKPKPIIMKSICDFADEDKNDEYQEIAMKISANAFYTLFTEYINMD
jgi:nucleoside phosphorylase